jgi:hypothetical protein
MLAWLLRPYSIGTGTTARILYLRYSYLGTYGQDLACYNVLCSGISGGDVRLLGTKPILHPRVRGTVEAASTLCIGPAYIPHNHESKPAYYYYCSLRIS